MKQIEKRKYYKHLNKRRNYNKIKFKGLLNKDKLIFRNKKKLQLTQIEKRIKFMLWRQIEAN